MTSSGSESTSASPAEEAEKRSRKAAHGHKRIMRRKKDDHFGMICRFFDTGEALLRDLPGAPRRLPLVPRTPAAAAITIFWSFERRAQRDPEFVAVTDHT